MVQQLSSQLLYASNNAKEAHHLQWPVHLTGEAAVMSGPAATLHAHVAGSVTRLGGETDWYKFSEDMIPFQARF